MFLISFALQDFKSDYDAHFANRARQVKGHFDRIAKAQRKAKEVKPTALNPAQIKAAKSRKAAFPLDAPPKVDGRVLAGKRKRDLNQKKLQALTDANVRFSIYAL
jgi:hypothetical protein